MKTRIITAVLLLPLLLLIILFANKIFTAILFAALSAVASYELLKTTGYIDSKPLLYSSALTAFLVCFISYFDVRDIALLIVVFVFTVAIFAQLMLSRMSIPFDKAFVCFAGAVIVPYLLSSLVRIQVMASGRYYILIPFTLAFLSDTGAYFTGIAIGKHKLAPIISPKKTIEGVVGGILGAIIGMIIYCVVLQMCFSMQPNYLFAIIYGILGSAFAVFGDLCLSVIKRQTGIKDYGKLFPGHGGVLDRFDSMLTVAPLTEILLILLPLAV